MQSKDCALLFAHFCCTISRSCSYSAQSWDWNAISGFWECATQSPDCTDSQIAQILRLRRFSDCADSQIARNRYTPQALKILCVELASWAHLSTIPRCLATCYVQCETTVSVFLGFTLQCAFVRQWFVSILKHMHSYVAHRVCPLQTSSFDCNTAFEALYCRTSAKDRAHAE